MATKTVLDYYDEGWAAASENLWLRDNPYKLGHKGYNSWRQGWHDYWMAR